MGNNAPTTTTPPAAPTPPDAPKETKAAKVLKLVTTANLSEGGKHYKPGEEIEVTAERAKALGSFVKLADAE